MTKEEDEMTERDKLANELFGAFDSAKTSSVHDNHTRWLAVADWVIADRKHIVMPLIELKNQYDKESFHIDYKEFKAISETLKLSGVSDER